MPPWHDQPAPREGPISYRRTFNRFEYKYLVSHAQVRRLRAELAPFVRPDRHGEHQDGYRVFSVYWDSPARRFFWEKIEGVGFRRKLRFRRYGSADETYIEIKQRLGRTVQKRRVQWDLARVVEAFWGPAGPAAAPPEAFEDPLAAEVSYLINRFQLRPAVAISYRRRALYGHYDPDLRITFDTRVQYEPRRTNIADPFDVGKYVVDPRLTVMEVKFNERVPRWFGKMARANQLDLVRLSKFCTAVDREYYGGVLT